MTLISPQSHVSSCCNPTHHAAHHAAQLQALTLIDALRVPSSPIEPGIEVVVVGPRGFADGTTRAGQPMGSASAPQPVAAPQDIPTAPQPAEAEHTGDSTAAAAAGSSGGERRTLEASTSHAVTAPIGPLEWSGEATAAYRQPDGALDLWVRLELSKPRKLSQLRVRQAALRE